MKQETTTTEDQGIVVKFYDIEGKQISYSSTPLPSFAIVNDIPLVYAITFTTRADNNGDSPLTVRLSSDSVKTYVKDSLGIIDQSKTSSFINVLPTESKSLPINGRATFPESQLLVVNQWEGVYDFWVTFTGTYDYFGRTQTIESNDHVLLTFRKEQGIGSFSVDLRSSGDTDGLAVCGGVDCKSHCGNTLSFLGETSTSRYSNGYCNLVTQTCKFKITPNSQECGGSDSCAGITCNTKCSKDNTGLNNNCGWTLYWGGRCEIVNNAPVCVYNNVPDSGSCVDRYGTPGGGHSTVIRFSSNTPTNLLLDNQWIASSLTTDGATSSTLIGYGRTSDAIIISQYDCVDDLRFQILYNFGNGWYITNNKDVSGDGTIFLCNDIGSTSGSENYRYNKNDPDTILAMLSTKVLEYGIDGKTYSSACKEEYA